MQQSKLVKVLVYSEEYDRMGILNLTSGNIRLLHCGDTFKIKTNKGWDATRIEYRWNKKEWYLVGCVELHGNRLKKGKFIVKENED